MTQGWWGMVRDNERWMKRTPFYGDLSQLSSDSCFYWPCCWWQHNWCERALMAVVRFGRESACVTATEVVRTAGRCTLMSDRCRDRCYAESFQAPLHPGRMCQGLQGHSFGSPDHFLKHYRTTYHWIIGSPNHSLQHYHINLRKKLFETWQEFLQLLPFFQYFLTVPSVVNGQLF